MQIEIHDFIDFFIKEMALSQVAIVCFQPYETLLRKHYAEEYCKL